MYKVMLVFDNYDLLEKILSLHIWGEISDFEISSIVRDGNSAYKELKSQRFDLVITEVNITGMEGLQLLRCAKSEGLCKYFALCSENSNFDYARQGIILGAYDYFVEPFYKHQLVAMFSRIKNENNKRFDTEIYYAKEIISFFDNHDIKIYDYVPKILEKIYSEFPDVITANKKIYEIYTTVIKDIFERNDWLDLYAAQSKLYSIDNFQEEIEGDYSKYYSNNLFYLFDEYSRLFPDVNNDKIQEVILYILYNPESDLRQKTISEKLYINCSYLSTVFTAHTNLRFIDYLTYVKMARASLLLQNTNLKITEIALRLDYKDMGYFSRLFKKHYNVTPSQYRIPENYNFQI